MRTYKSTPEYFAFISDNATRAVFFIHGLRSQKTRVENYWGKTIQILASKALFESLDFYALKYPSSQSVFPRTFVPRFIGHHKPMTVEHTVQVLHNRITNINRKNYDKIAFYGHSLGGLISLKLARLWLNNNKPVGGIHTNAMPWEAPGIACLANTISLRSNRHISYLADQSSYDDVFPPFGLFNNKNVQIFEMSFNANDEIVKPPMFEIPFKAQILQANHHWYENVDASTGDLYLSISNFLERVVYV